MDEAVLHIHFGELDPGRIEQVTSLCFFPVVHAGLTGVFFLDRLRQQLGDGVSFSECRGMFLLSIFSVGSCVRLLAYRVPAIFLTQKPAWFRIYADFLCEPEGLSPDGGLFYSTDVEPHQTGEPRGPLPSGGKTSAKSLFLYAPAR